MIDTSLLIKTEVTKHSRVKEIDPKNIAFGRNLSDHMFIAEYKNGEWNDLRIIPYGPLPLSPAISSLHYGQTIFEGMKAFRMDNGQVVLFRPYENARRINVSAQRMCMPAIPENIFMEGLLQLIKLDSEWVFKEEGCSLYVRPFMFANEEALGVKSSNSYMFMILTSPVGPYYRDPVKVKIETKYARACEGGVGFTKAAGNYGVSLYPTKLSHDEGYTQLIWTDAKDHEYIEEAGMMNIMFVINNTLITPSLANQTILPGITRDSLILLARDWGMKVEERRISIREVIDALNNGDLTEAFGCGTAATVALISAIGYKGIDYAVPADNPDCFSSRAAKYLTNLRKGRIADTHNWLLKV